MPEPIESPTAEPLGRLLARLERDRDLQRDFEAFCDCGGRVAGSESEDRARAFAVARLSALPGGQLRRESVRYGGWRLRSAGLVLLDGGGELPCQVLLRSVSTPPEGIEGEVLDLGRGTPEQFEAHAGEIRGRIVLVRHEYMFCDGTQHRRRKYEQALRLGAIGFLIASPHPGLGPVAGSTGRNGPEGIPGLGIDQATAKLLAPRLDRLPRVRILVAAEEAPSEAENLILELPGQEAEWVVLSAHLDGHDLAESAMDNATGLAVALAVARALAEERLPARRGLRLCFFNVEEWALTGSRLHVERLSAAERAAIALNVNLDSVAGHPELTALTSGFPGLEPFLRGSAAAVGRSLRCYRPRQANSDHFNFAEAGIPALRLVAGFDAPDSNLRYVLTPADTRDRVAAAELATAARLTAAIVWRGLTAPPAEAEAWRRQAGVE